MGVTEQLMMVAREVQSGVILSRETLLSVDAQDQDGARQVAGLA